MKGDNCSRHPDKKAVGYYSNGRTYGFNGCKECMEKNKRAKYVKYY